MEGGGIRGGGAGAVAPSMSHQQKNERVKMLLVAARYHNIVVFRTQQQWKDVNDTIAD